MSFQLKMPTECERFYNNDYLTRSAVPWKSTSGWLIHSDQGVQYESDAWRRFCRSNHLEPSMSRKGNCRDNAVAECFFGSLKKEWVKKRIYKNRQLALADVSDYIETFHNQSRRHSHQAT